MPRWWWTATCRPARSARCGSWTAGCRGTRTGPGWGWWTSAPARSGRGCRWRLRGRCSTVYCLLGDGECQEGQVWEALLYAGAHQVPGLVAIIDHNGSQSDGAVDDILPLRPLPAKLRAFGWQVSEVDGHDHGALRDVLRRRDPARPAAIIARTRKGRLGPGRLLLDGSHSDLPSPAEYAAAVGYLESLLAGGA
jgi:transketolase